MVKSAKDTLKIFFNGSANKEIKKSNIPCLIFLVSETSFRGVYTPDVKSFKSGTCFAVAGGKKRKKID